MKSKYNDSLWPRSMLNGVCLMSEKVTRTKNNAIWPKIMKKLHFSKDLQNNVIFIFKNQKNCRKTHLRVNAIVNDQFFASLLIGGGRFSKCGPRGGYGFSLGCGRSRGHSGHRARLCVVSVHVRTLNHFDLNQKRGRSTQITLTWHQCCQKK